MPFPSRGDMFLYDPMNLADSEIGQLFRQVNNGFGDVFRAARLRHESAALLNGFHRPA